MGVSVGSIAMFVLEHGWRDADGMYSVAVISCGLGSIAVALSSRGLLGARRTRTWRAIAVLSAIWSGPLAVYSMFLHT